MSLDFGDTVFPSRRPASSGWDVELNPVGKFSPWRSLEIGVAVWLSHPRCRARKKSHTVMDTLPGCFQSAVQIVVDEGKPDCKLKLKAPGLREHQAVRKIGVFPMRPCIGCRQGCSSLGLASKSFLRGRKINAAADRCRWRRAACAPRHCLAWSADFHVMSCRRSTGRSRIASSSLTSRAKDSSASSAHLAARRLSGAICPEDGVDDHEHLLRDGDDCPRLLQSSLLEEMPVVRAHRRILAWAPRPAPTGAEVN